MKDENVLELQYLIVMLLGAFTLLNCDPSSHKAVHDIKRYGDALFDLIEPHRDAICAYGLIHHEKELNEAAHQARYLADLLVRMRCTQNDTERED